MKIGYTLQGIFDVGAGTGDVKIQKKDEPGATTASIHCLIQKVGVTTLPGELRKIDGYGKDSDYHIYTGGYRGPWIGNQAVAGQEGGILRG